MILYIRAFIFHVIFYLWTFGYLIFCLPYTIKKKQAKMHAHLKCWSLVNLWLMKYLLKIDFSMENQHNYSSSKNNIYAIKHQSALETITIFAFFDQPVIILKQEIR